MTVITFEPRKSSRRNGPIKSAHSWIKHDNVAKPIGAQVGAYRVRFPDHKILLIDGNAGDGIGVMRLEDQADLFLDEELSRTTPEILTAIAEDMDNCDVCLCEQNQGRREELWKRFPNAQIVSSHAEIPYLVRDHSYALWVSDPCGYAGHGVEHMRVVNQRLLTDFVVILNEIALKRVQKTTGDAWKTHRLKYGDMIDPQWWLKQLGKQFLSRSRVFPQSSGFHFRIMVVSNFIADGARRAPFAEVITREEKKPA